MTSARLDDEHDVTKLRRANKTLRGRIFRLPLALAVAAVVIGAAAMITYARHNDTTGSQPEFVVKILKTSRYGDILVSRGGYTLYTYSEDTRDHSNCVAFCLELWPPLVVRKGVIPSGRGVTGLGTFARTNGQRQVTYRGKPLYLFAFDHIPGHTSGEGNGWSVVQLK